MQPLTRRTLIGTLGAVAVTGCAKNDPGSSNQSPSGSTASSSGSPTSSPTSPTTSPTPTSPSPAGPVSVKISADHPLDALEPVDSLRITVANGTLQRVEVTDGSGRAVPGTVDKDIWTPDKAFDLGARYDLTATAEGSDGSTVTETARLTTVDGRIARFQLLYADMLVGVGMPLMIRFNEGVPEQYRAGVEQHLTVTTTPQQAGSWGWLDDQNLMWRPADFWKPGSKVRVIGRLTGVRVGQRSFLGRELDGGLTISPDARISYVDIDKFRMTVTKNGKTVNTFPVTNGKSGFTTRSGTKVISEMYDSLNMNSETVDIPSGSGDSYNLMVKYAMRLTWTGEFIHAAPWSTWAHGKKNVSHGCTGLTTDRADWLYSFHRIGDPVIYRGSNRQLKPHEGIGVWCYSFADWRTLSASR